jgi:hypothetical protein
MFIDITDRLLPALDTQSMVAIVAEAKRMMGLLSHPQAGLMLAKMAAHHSDSLGSARDEYYDFSHAMNFRALATCLSEFIDPGVDLSFDEPRRPDEAVHRVFALQLMNETNLHQAACIRNGLRRIWYDPERDHGELRLTKRRRRSALTLIDPVAQMDLLQSTAGWNDGKDAPSDDAVFFAFASAEEHLKFVREADPKSWARFEAATGVSADLLTSFSGFLCFLDFAARQVGHSLAYSEEKLETLAGIYKDAYPGSTLDANNVMRLVRLFSLTAKECCNLLLPVPFFRFGERYLRYVGFVEIMSTAIGLLTILVRMHDQAWNNTVGSTLARAADVLAATLPNFTRLRVAVRRKLKGGGDVDLAIYDTQSQHLLLCEVKTVYDKHRTVLHMHRFEEAKVKVDHAVAQLRHATTSVLSGATDMHALFQQKLPRPLRVSAALLTWFDPVDLTVGTPDEDILSLNFATFRYLLVESDGDIDQLCRANHELRNIWCPAQLLPIDLQTEFPTMIEVQVGAVDSEADLAAFELSPLARRELARMPALDHDWRTSNSQPPLVSYLGETMGVLGSQEIEAM